MFVFGQNIGDGSDDNHFQVGFTSVKLINRMTEFKQGVFHIDATYKIVKNCFPLIVLGFTDLSRKFFPVAFMFTSHEETRDYDYFFHEFKSLCRRLGIDFDPSHMVSDACHASFNAISRHFPSCCILMCWFHLKQNIRKHKSKIPVKRYRKTMKEIDELHRCGCHGSYKVSKNYQKKNRRVKL